MPRRCFCVSGNSYLEYLDGLWGQKEGDSNAYEGQADDEKAGDDDASGEYRLPCREPLLSKCCVIRSLRCLFFFLHSCAVQIENIRVYCVTFHYIHSNAKKQYTFIVENCWLSYMH